METTAHVVTNVCIAQNNVRVHARKDIFLAEPRNVRMTVLGNGIGLVGTNASTHRGSAAMELAMRDSLPVEINAKKTKKLTGGGIGLVETGVS